MESKMNIQHLSSHGAKTHSLRRKKACVIHGIFRTLERGMEMQKLIRASLILAILAVLQTKVFAMSLDCKFKETVVAGVQSIEVNDEAVVINHAVAIPLEKSRVKCGSFGKQVRFDGTGQGYQVILESCSAEAKLEGHLIDEVNEVAAEVQCFQKAE